MTRTKIIEGRIENFLSNGPMGFLGYLLSSQHLPQWDNSQSVESGNAPNTIH